MATNPFEGLTVDRIGTDIVIHCPDEEMAEAGRRAFDTVLPMFGILTDLLENGGLSGLFGDL